MPSHAHFEIDLVAALVDQLVAAFARLETGALSEGDLAGLGPGQGVYQLFHRGALVYVGKAGQLAKRLSEHLQKVSGRRNIAASEMGFKCLFIHPNWTALVPEKMLIRHYRRSGTGDCSWNGNGFGSHDPERTRETTNKPPDGFDAQHPIRDDWRCEWIRSGQYNCKELLKSLKWGLPYVLRYETAGSVGTGHPDYNSVTVTLSESSMSAREILATIAKQLPGWQATAFPSHMILYEESKPYDHGEILWGGPHA